jgi:dihydropteroate synthase
VQVLRVHDVAESAQAAAVWSGISSDQAPPELPEL